VEIAIGTSPGIRQRRNDDGHLSEPIGPVATLFGVADGFGSLGRGVASAGLALEAVRDFVRRRQRLGALRTRSTPGALRTLMLGAFEHANARLYAQGRSDDDFVAGGASLTAALVVGRHAYIGHVGDTRAYIQRLGRLELLTGDDAIFGEPLTGPRGAVGAQPRGVLWRSLGTQPKLEASVAHVELLPGDQLVLCSDGIHRCVMAEEMNETLTGSSTAAEAVTRVLALAKMRGTLDSATLVIARDMLSPAIPQPSGAAVQRSSSALAGAIILVTLLILALTAFH